MGNLAKKMVAAMGEVDAIEKKGQNKQQGYAYVKATDVAREVRAALIKHGIAFTFSVVDDVHWDAPTKSGGVMYFVKLVIDFVFRDTDSDEIISVRSIGWGTDSMDKAPYKAMTGALKYALRLTFLIPDESDPEASHEEQIKPKEQYLPELAPLAEEFIAERVKKLEAAPDLDTAKLIFKDSWKTAKLAKDDTAVAMFEAAYNGAKKRIAAGLDIKGQLTASLEAE